jgi:hypothetical protein
MDESIQRELLQGRTRAKARRVTAENRKLFKAALMQLEQEGPPLKHLPLVAIAKSVQAICGVPVAESSLRALIEDAGLTPPPIGPARVKRDPVNKPIEDADQLEDVRIQILASRRELERVRAVLLEAMEQVGQAAEVWKILRNHMVSVSTTAAELQRTLQKAESLTDQVTPTQALDKAPQ